MKLLSKLLKIIIIIALLVAIGFVIYSYYIKVTYKTKNPIVTMEVEDFGTIVIELYPDKAPNTVANFIALANNGFYDGLTFHRTIPDFMIQGGDNMGTGEGSPTLSAIDSSIEKGSAEDKEYAIKGEFPSNDFNQNDIKFEKGVLAMARGDYSSMGTSYVEYGYNSAGSQFFIMTEDTNTLNGLYAAFGRVIEGQDIVDAISNVEVIAREEDQTEETSEEIEQTDYDRPVNPPVIKSIKVETYGVDYGMPETVEPFDYNSWYMQNYSQYFQ